MKQKRSMYEKESLDLDSLKVKFRLENFYKILFPSFNLYYIERLRV